MLPANLGCPHDYMLTPQDMLKLTQADILIINGLGMENFLQLQELENIPILDSSQNIPNILYDDTTPLHLATHKHTDKKTCVHTHQHIEKNTCKHIDNNMCKHIHQHINNANPHLFASPLRAGQIAIQIAEQLSTKYSQYTTQLQTNAQQYQNKMNQLHKEWQNAISQLQNKKIITYHNILDYLAQDTGLEIITTLQEHTDATASPSEILQIIQTIQEHNVGAICTEPQYQPTLANTIVQETNIPLIQIDPVASGPDNPSLDYYITTMQANIQNILKLQTNRKEK